jgi:pyruvate,orthophosphate dikinase
MIEVPRAALRSANIVEHADFFSFGTNDLTQMTLGFSRDDVSSFMPSYIEQEVLEVDPFMSIDEAAVGFLVSFATHMGRSVKPGLSVGVCGEHGGDPASIEFFYNSELSYVSCSPFRVPIARLAGAQAALKSEAAAKASGKKPAVKKAADKKPAKPKAKKLKAEKPKVAKSKTEKVTAKKAVGKKPAKAKKK